MKTAIPAHQLCAEILTTFSNMVARTIPTGKYHCPSGCVEFAGEGTWSNGSPILSDAYDDHDEYNGPVLKEFERWLEDRGYAWDRYDEFIFIAIPLVHFEALSAAFQVTKEET